MANCTHCTKTISRDVKMSAEIPTQKDCKYIMCGGCGNVMIALVDGKDVLEILPTPQDNSPATMTMVIEAASLFAAAGHGQAQYALTANGARQSIPKSLPESNEAEEDEQESVSEASTSEHEDRDKDRRQEEEESGDSEKEQDVITESHDESSPTFLRRVGQFFKRLFGRSA